MPFQMANKNQPVRFFLSGNRPITFLECKPNPKAASQFYMIQWVYYNHIKFQLDLMRTSWEIKLWTVWCCCDLEKGYWSLKVTWSWTAQWILSPCKAWQLSHFDGQKEVWAIRFVHGLKLINKELMYIYCFHASQTFITQCSTTVKFFTKCVSMLKHAPRNCTNTEKGDLTMYEHELSKMSTITLAFKHFTKQSTHVFQ